MSKSYSALRVILTGFFRDRVDVFAVQRFDSLDAAVAKVRSGDLPAVVAQQGDTVLLRYAASDQVASATIRGIIGAAIAQANVDAASGCRPHRHGQWPAPASASAWSPPWHRPRYSSGWR
jgi:hypothetical protein